MMKNISLLFLFSSLLCFAQEVKQPIVLSQAIDFLDNCFFTQRGDYYSREELRERVRMSYDAGFRKIYFRGTGGVSYYPSRVRKMFEGELRPGGAKLAKTIRSYDVVAEYLDVCHELGMKLYYWEPIFDTATFVGYSPGTPGYDEWGEAPYRDWNIKEEHFTAHRKAALPLQALPRPITMLKLHTDFATDVSQENLQIYTAPHGKSYIPYSKPYKFRYEPQGKGGTIILQELEISDPCIKFGGKIYVISNVERADCVEAFYADGTPVELFCSCEIVLQGDEDPIHTLHGNGVSTAWGHKIKNRTLIARFGDFERYAIGHVDYAHKEMRDRMENIVRELYERYPKLDGVAFSIRTHSLPAPGNDKGLGYGKFFYGFSEPVVQEYQRRFGIDPREAPYDETAFLKIRGEFLTQMLDGVSRIVHSHGGKLEMMAPVRDSVLKPVIKSWALNASLGSMWVWWRNVGIDDFFDVETWAKKGMVDNVIMLGTGYRQSVWTPEWTDEIARFRNKLKGTNTRLTMHYLINENEQEEVDALLPKLFAEANLDEIEFYEEYHVFADPVKYPGIRRIVENSGRNPLQ